MNTTDDVASATTPSEHSTTASAVTVTFFAAAAEASGTTKTQIPLTGDTESLADFVNRLPAEFPPAVSGAGLQRICELSTYLHNGVFARPDSTRLHAGDNLDILPPFAGG